MPTLPFHFSFTHSHAPQFIAPILVSYVSAFIGTWLSIRLAHRLKHLDHPGERSSHATPIPRFGGLGIALGFYAPLAIFARLEEPNTAVAAYLVAIWAGGLFALIFGLVDDVRAMHPLIKLLLQAICAGIPLLFGVHFPLNGHPILSHALTFLWIVFFMNAFNFMDGMDGNTASFGVIVAAGMAFPMLLAWQMVVEPFARVLALIALACALLAFMRFNVSRPAKTFMGDCGSQMVGYLLALGLVALPAGFAPSAFLLFWPFVYDVIYTLIKRSIRGENILKAHREHLYQRLLRCGLTHRQSLRYSIAFLVMCLFASFYSVVGYLQTRTQRSWFASAGIVLLAAIAYTAVVLFHERRKMTATLSDRVESDRPDERR